MVARLIRLLAIAICLLLAASFAMFGLDQARSASQNSVSEISGKTPYGAPHSVSGPHHAWPRQAIDDGASALESPFTSVGVQSSNQWGEHVALLVLGLLLYGAGLGFFARWVGSGPRLRRGRHRDDPAPPGQAFAA
ncbi:MAG TPA: hypothetical protein VGY97_00045 [Solirubrobacteraceae bacterium]|jgi:hypothetical protein|nr:hypothetical protein [Solirubrobacteraceae bacterium]